MFQSVLSLLSNPINRKILSAIKNRKVSAGELALMLNLSPAALSYHLKKMKTAGLIYETKYKNFIYYQLDLTLLNELILWLSDLKGGFLNEEN